GCTPRFFATSEFSIRSVMPAPDVAWTVIAAGFAPVTWQRENVACTVPPMAYSEIGALSWLKVVRVTVRWGWPPASPATPTAAAAGCVRIRRSTTTSAARTRMMSESGSFVRLSEVGYAGGSWTAKSLLQPPEIVSDVEAIRIAARYFPPAI